MHTYIYTFERSLYMYVCMYVYNIHMGFFMKKLTEAAKEASLVFVFVFVFVFVSVLFFF